MLGVMLMMSLGIVANFGFNLSLSQNTTKADFGYYQYWLSYAQLGAMFLAVGLPQAALRFIPQYLEDANSSQVKYFIAFAERRLGVMIFGGFIVILATSLLIQDWIAGVVLCQFASLLWMTWRSDVMQSEQRRVAARFFGQLLIPLANLAVFWGMFFYFGEAVSLSNVVFGVLLAGWFAVILSYSCRRKYKATAAREPALTEEWKKSSLTILTASISTLLMARADRIMVGWFCGHEAVAEYAVSMQLCLLMPLGATIINRYLGQYYGRDVSQGSFAKVRKNFRLTRLLSIAFALPILAIFCAFGSYLLGLFGKGYEESHLLLVVLALGQLVNVAFAGVAYVMIGLGQERQYARVMMGACGLNVVLNAIFIPFFGNIGAAGTSLLTFVLWNVGLYVLIKKHLRHHEQSIR